MSFSAVKIANMALSHVGERSYIESLTADTSEQARICNLWYDTCLRQTLQDFDWNFARKREVLAAHPVAAPTNEWGYRYVYPSDCLRLRAIVNPSGWNAERVRFEVRSGDTEDGRSICTDMAEASAVYTRYANQPELFPAYFAETLSYCLAAKVAYSLTQKRTLQNDMYSIYRQMAAEAQASEGNEGLPNDPPDSPIIRGRL